MADRSLLYYIIVLTLCKKGIALLYITSHDCVIEHSITKSGISFLYVINTGNECNISKEFKKIHNAETEVKFHLSSSEDGLW